MKQILTSFIIIILITISSRFLHSEQKENKFILSQDEKTLFAHPYFTSMFGIRSGYSFITSKHNGMINNGLIFSGFYVYNPRIINDLLFEANIGYSSKTLKTDDNGYYKNINISANGKYLFPFTYYLNGYGFFGGGYNIDMLHTEFSSEKDKTFYNPILNGGLGLEYAYNYSYIFDLRGKYSYIFYKDKAFNSAGIEIGIGYSLDADPGQKIGKFLECKQNIKIIFPAQAMNYSENYIDKVTITNNLKRKLTSLKVWLKNSEYIKGDVPTEEFKNIQPSAKIEYPLKIILTENAQKLSNDKTDYFDLMISYKVEGVNDDLIMKVPITVTIIRSRGLTWDDTRKVGSFITTNESVISKFIRDAIVYLKATEESKNYYIPLKPLVKAIQVYSALCTHGLKYVSDPNGIKIASSYKQFIDTIQYPREFLKSKTGDCDDFSILFCTLLENIGVNSAVITIPGHIYVAFDTGLDIKSAERIFCNKYVNGKNIGINFKFTAFIKKNNTAWIPVETTLISSNKSFFEAWKIGIVEFKRNKEQAVIIPVADIVDKYYPNSLPNSSDIFSVNNNNLITNFKNNANEIKNWVKQAWKKNSKNPKNNSKQNKDIKDLWNFD